MSDKPLIKMNELEFERTFADLNKSIYENMLRDARKGTEEKYVLSLVVLITASGAKRIVGWNAEYGDDESIANNEMVRRIRRLDMLEPGETVEHLTTEIDLTTNRWVPVL